MIASNYRKHPAALALQLPLPFGHLLRWALPRPGARILRAIRVARAEAFKAAGRVAYPVKRAVPTWYAEARKRARRLANQVKAECLAIFGTVHLAVSVTETEHIGFSYNEPADTLRQLLDDFQDSGCDTPSLRPDASYFGATLVSTGQRIERLCTAPTYQLYCNHRSDVEIWMPTAWGHYSPYWGGHSV